MSTKKPPAPPPAPKPPSQPPKQPGFGQDSGESVRRGDRTIEPIYQLPKPPPQPPKK